MIPAFRRLAKPLSEETFRRVVHATPPSTFRRLAQWPLLDFGENVYLRGILGALINNACLKGCEAEIVETTTEVSELVEIRYIEPRALTTTICNKGEHEAMIFEDGQLIYILDTLDTVTMPLGGKHHLTSSSEGTTVITTTHLRCQCNNPSPYYGPEEIVAPIGAFLL